MTNLPKALRAKLAEATDAGAAGRRSPCQRRRRHGQVPVGAARRQAHRDRADAVPRSRHGLRQQPGRVCDGMRVLRHRPGRLRPPPHRRRDRRAGRRRRPRGTLDGSAARQRRVHGNGRAAGQRGRRVGFGRAHARRSRVVGAQADDLDRRAGAGHSPADRAAAAGQPRRVAARRQRSICATSWFRSTSATRSTN